MKWFYLLINIAFVIYCSLLAYISAAAFYGVLWKEGQEDLLVVSFFWFVSGWFIITILIEIISDYIRDAIIYNKLFKYSILTDIMFIVFSAVIGGPIMFLGAASLRVGYGFKMYLAKRKN